MASWVRKSLDLTKLPRVKLNNIQDLPGAKKNKIRVGRGPGSRRGKTCGRGHKGQGQRNSGAVRVGFEGGQTPFYLSIPKHGFKNKFQVRYESLNLGKLQWLVDCGRIDTSKPINMLTLQKAGAVGRIKHGIKLLGDGAEWFKAKVDIEVTQASQKAIEAIEKAGGTFTAAYYNRLGLRVLLKPEKFEDRPLPRRALPNNKLMAYYLDPKNKGYLLTEAGKERLKQGGMEGAYRGEDGRVHIPGRRINRYSDPSPSQPNMEKVEELKDTGGGDDGPETDLGTPV